MEIKLITPIAIEEGLRFAIREGGRTVGAGVVSGVSNKQNHTEKVKVRYPSAFAEIAKFL